MHSSPLAVRVQSDDVGEDVEPDQEPELELDGDERRELEEPRASDDLAEEHVARGGQRQRARLRDRCACAPNVGLVQLERGAQLDDRRRGVPDRGEPVADLVVPVARVDAPSVAEDGLEDRPDLVGAPLEEVGVEACEPLLGAAIRGALGACRQRAGEG